MFCFERRGRVLFVLRRRFALPLCILLFCASSLSAQTVAERPLGVAFRVRGAWQVEGQGAMLRDGDPLVPGSLLRPGPSSTAHSITVLLPDGVRVLYECYEAEDCGRGFRVPPLYRRPVPFAAGMMAHIRAGLLMESAGSSSDNDRPAPRLPRDEAVAVLRAGNRARVKGLAAYLDNGRYTYDLHPLNGSHAGQFQRVFEKNASFIELQFPSTGLYDVTIFDDLNTPRIELLVAVVSPAQAARYAGLFNRADALLHDWDEDYQGWPIHEFQHAYLESLFSGSKPPARIGDSSPSASSTMAAGNGIDGSIAAEPAFSPAPGVFNGNTAVTMRCSTPGATMRFTVDGSQPLANSPVYSAPIMVKGTELTIKAYAQAPGKKDSAVVTGIFRIRDKDD
jgi:hypothetical protein